MTTTTRILIIGAGHAGICMGMQLKRAGIHDFVILEKSSSLGGTWRDNTYPGASCDAPSFLYSFSFAQKTDWSRRFAWQPELLAYSVECAVQAGLLPHCRFNAEVVAARFDGARDLWRVELAGGEAIEASFLVSGVGQLHRPAIPAIPGRDSFGGPQFHSARWDHGVDLAGKHVAVIGNAASAVQFVPQIAPLCAALTIFQRSANWLMPRKDHLYSARVQRWMTRWPWLAKTLHDFQWFFFGELQLTPLMKQVRVVQWLATQRSRAHLRRQVKDPALRAKLLPDYPIGAKRVLFNDDYYPTLARPNARLVTDAIAGIEPAGVRTAAGEFVPADVLIFATGFHATEFLAPMRITGAAGRSLDEEWRSGAHAYLGITVSGFPNFFMLYGPNTNLGHNSILVMIEAQVNYVIEAIRQMDARGLRRLDVRRETMDEYNRWLRRDLAKSVWAADKQSWYKLADGTITNNWPHSTIRYRRLLRDVDLGVFDTTP